MLVLQKPWAWQPPNACGVMADLVGPLDFVYLPTVGVVHGPRQTAVSGVSRVFDARGALNQASASSDRVTFSRFERLTPGAWAYLFVVKRRSTAAKFLCGVLDTGSSYIEQVGVNMNSSEAASTGNIMLGYRSTANVLRQRATTSAPLQKDQWHGVVLQLESDLTYRCFVDGVEHTMTGDSTTPGASSGQMDYDLALLNRNNRGAFSVASTDADVALFARFAHLVPNPAWLSANAWALFQRRVLVPVSAAGGGAITIDGNLGNATAAGTAGQVGVAITVDASTGNATAAGATAQVGVSIDITATTGNAVAAGITGVVDLGGSITIDGNVGAAVAAGVQGLPGVAITIDGAAGGAVAAGVSGGVTVTNDITINATAGGAVAAGILAGLSLDIEVAGVIGNATAAGTTGTVSLSGSGTGATAAEIWSYTLSSGLTAEATLVAIHTMLSELHLIHGLTAGSPLSVTAASRAAGAVSQAVAEAAGTVTVTRQ